MGAGTAQTCSTLTDQVANSPRSHVGSTPDHCLLELQSLAAFPTSTAPLAQVYVARDPNSRPLLKLMSPLLGGVRLPQDTPRGRRAHLSSRIMQEEWNSKKKKLRGGGGGMGVLKLPMRDLNSLLGSLILCRSLTLAHGCITRPRPTCSTCSISSTDHIKPNTTFVVRL